MFIIDTKKKQKEKWTLEIFSINKRNIIFYGYLFFIIIFAIYTQMILKTDIGYTHLFYFSIIMAGAWHYEKIIRIGIFYILLHLTLGYLNIGYIAVGMLVRSLSIIFFSYTIKYIVEIIDFKNREIKMEKRKLNNLIKSIGDGVIAIDLNRNIISLNKVAERITGWSFDQSIGKNVDDIFKIGHENKKNEILNPLDEVLRTGKIQYLSKHAILINKNGERINIEDSASPIEGINGTMTGVVLIFRDVTEKKEDDARIEYMSYHDALTGLYNRRYFEDSLKQLDVEHNYPLSILMGDLNNLKMANDAFGHLAGDEVIKNAADILIEKCRKDDIVARWGGDEFVILMANTEPEEVEKIVARIKEESLLVNLKTGPLSIAFGWDTKNFQSEDIEQTFINAENYMYKSKLHNSPSVRGKTIDMIMEALFEKSPREKDHSERVSMYSHALGEALSLSGHVKEDLKTIGLLHDIGKIIIGDNVLEKKEKLTDDEWAEIKQHPIIGYRIINCSMEMSDIALGILTHHEHWDGTGYPKGLKGTDIPLTARIIAVADAYDAMTSERPYGHVLDKNHAAEEIIDKMGTHFDPEIAKVFVSDILQSDLKVQKICRLA